MNEVDALAAEIRRVDGAHSLGAGALAEALMPFITAVRTEERSRALHDAFWAVHVGRFRGRDSVPGRNTFYVGTNAAKRAIEDLHGAPITQRWGKQP